MNWTVKNTVLCLGAVSALALAFALVAQKGFGYAPCELCLIERAWHDVVAAAAILMLVAKRPRLFLNIQAGALVICLGYALFHVGVEQHWWHGTQACTGDTGTSASLEDLTEKILAAPVVRCDEVRWRLFGLSMAVYNALLTFVMAAVAITTLMRKR